MPSNTTIPVLIDFDGVIRIGDKIADDAELFFHFLDSNKIPFYIISNSTQSTGSDIRMILKSSGVRASINAMTTVDATINYLSGSKEKVSLYCKEGIKKYFEEFLSNEKPDAVVIGDMEDAWSYEVLNDIFRKVLNGARIIAMQKNKFWKPAGKKLSLDAGAFISAIEYATSKEALLIGKPSPIYFNSAISKLGFPERSKFIMIGDDITTDIQGAKNNDGITILIYTGKTQKNYNIINTVEPDFEADSLTDTIQIIQKLLD